MCGIAGIVNYGGSDADLAAVVNMADAIAHRGPDGEGAVFFGRAGQVERLRVLKYRDAAEKSASAIAALAHKRLAIIDLSERGAQPMADISRRYWITFNGEIYNYVELRDELTKHGCMFKSASDTEVILNAYRIYGVECVKRLNGMFAFAIWDCRDQSLYCARDHLGVKPFYFLRTDREIYFASEQKGILAALDERPRPNLDAISDYLHFSYVPSDETMFEGIHSLGPGSYLMVKDGRITSEKFWDPVFEPPSASVLEGEREAELRELLGDSMRMQIRSDVPIGAHLSGGIDSSTVCCLASRYVPDLQTFTARFMEGGFYDESPYARLVATRISSDHREISPDRFQLAELLPQILYAMDEPVEAASVFGKYKIAEIVSEHVKVVLGGQGGDELFGGYDWYIKNVFTALVFGADLEVNGGSKWAFIGQVLKHESKKRLAKSLWQNLGVSNTDDIFCRNWSRFHGNMVSELFSDEIRAEYELTSKERFLAELHSLKERRAGDRMFKFDMQHYLQALLTSEDRLSMAFSVESRVPLLDYRIAEFAGKLGYEAKTRPGHSKDLLRRAAAEFVPSEILQRKDKRGFPTPIGTWLNDKEIGLLDKFVYSGNEFARQYFNLKNIRSMQKQRGYFSTDVSERLWRILTVCVWGDVFQM